jgi:hypothetical protein
MSYICGLTSSFYKYWREIVWFSYLSVFLHVLQGKGEFTMEYLEHNVVSQDVQMQLVTSYQAAKGTE